ncbi:MAG: 50S ribosomal protein L4 [Candidatus Woesearchaeota archaeon]|nr:MAG: 50S ribosomal protein L4 [Candidatus Woesearchaeota archaeon]
MELTVVSIANKELAKEKLPEQFLEPVRVDLIKKVVLALQANARNPYGAYKEAGKRHSAKVSKRRHNYRGTYGIGQSRTPRKVLNRRGTRFYFVGAFAPQTVGGRRAHPPKAEKIWDQKINKKENRKAIRSALAATIDKTFVAARGHKLPAAYPFVLENKAETLEKTKDVLHTLSTIGFVEELARTSKTSIRAGKGKMRGRKHVTKKGPLLVVADHCTLELAARNIPGVEVATVSQLNVELLAPGAEPGRLTVFTDKAIAKLRDEKLFI